MLKGIIIKKKNDSQIIKFDHDQLTKQKMLKQSASTSSESIKIQKSQSTKKFTLDELAHILLNEYQPASEIVNFQQLRNSPYVQMKMFKECIYFGEVVQNMMQGIGVMLYTNGRVYQGQWNRNVKEGSAYQKFPNQGVYKGTYKAGKPQGHGTYRWESNELYEGQWSKGFKHGSGIWRGANGDSYIGEWNNGQVDGYGVHTWKNGDRYQGQFKKCLKHGEGVEKFANGHVYRGSYVNGKPEGQGQYLWTDGSFYKGQFKNGLRSGKGVWKKTQDSQSDTYQGQYVNDKKQGQGVFTWTNGSTYKGGFKNDVRHGYGEMFWQDGNIFKGEWFNGQQSGQNMHAVQNNISRIEQNIIQEEENLIKEQSDNVLGNFQLSNSPTKYTITGTKNSIKRLYSAFQPQTSAIQEQGVVFNQIEFKPYLMNNQATARLLSNITCRDRKPNRVIKSRNQPRSSSFLVTSQNFSKQPPGRSLKSPHTRMGYSVSASFSSVDPNHLLYQKGVPQGKKVHSLQKTRNKTASTSLYIQSKTPRIMSGNNFNRRHQCWQKQEHPHPYTVINVNSIYSQKSKSKRQLYSSSSSSVAVPRLIQSSNGIRQKHQQHHHQHHQQNQHTQDIKSLSHRNRSHKEVQDELNLWQQEVNYLRKCGNGGNGRGTIRKFNFKEQKNIAAEEEKKFFTRSQNKSLYF